MNCCQHHCQTQNKERCQCDPFNNLTPDQIIDTIDYPFQVKNPNCCCCKPSEVVIIRKDDDVNINLPLTDDNIGIHALYRPPLKNGLKKDLTVNTTIWNPQRTFQQNEGRSIIYEDDFSTSNITRTGEIFKITTDLKTNKIVEVMEAPQGSGLLIEKNFTSQNHIFLNKNKLLGTF